MANQPSPTFQVMEDLGKPLLDVVLEPGDVLYAPRLHHFQGLGPLGLRIRLVLPTVQVKSGDSIQQLFGRSRLASSRTEPEVQWDWRGCQEAPNT